MAYVDGFVNDVFISYAHVNNKERGYKSVLDDGVSFGWVDAFCERLSVAIENQLDGVEIWRDKRKIDGADLFDNKIKAALESSLIFVALTSRRYLKSQYCRREAETFCEMIKEDTLGPEVQYRSRFYNILYDNVNQKDWLNCYPQSEGHYFCHKGGEGYSGPFAPGSDQFKNAVNSLASSIVVTLQLVKMEAKRKTVRPELFNSDNAKATSLFFADVTDSLWSTKSRIISAIKEEGIPVVTNIPPPLEKEIHSEAVSEALKHSIVSLHLFDDVVGKPFPEDSESNHRWQQVELALSSTVKPIIWVKKEVDLELVENESHRRFLMDIRDHRVSRSNRPYEFSREHDIHRLIRQVKDTWDKENNRHVIFNEARSVLLEAYQEDLVHAANLQYKLHGRQFTSHLDVDLARPSERVEFLKDMLSTVSCVVLMYGVVSSMRLKNSFEYLRGICQSQGIRDRRFVILKMPPKEKSWETSGHEIPDSRNLPKDVYLVDNSEHDDIRPDVVDQIVALADQAES